MKSNQRTSAWTYVGGLKGNAVLQLIIFLIVSYVVLAMCWAIIRLVYPTDSNYYVYFLPQVGLPAANVFLSHFWTIITYSWFVPPGNFWELFCNMLWLYCFGSVVQFLIGFRHVIPIYVYSSMVGGIMYVLAQFIPDKTSALALGGYLGHNAGLVGLAAASITIAPSYRIYLTEYFSISLAIVAGIFALLVLFSGGFALPQLFLFIGGGVMGYYYIILLKKGHQPGIWMYNFSDSIQSLVTPRTRAKIINLNTNKYNSSSRSSNPKGSAVNESRIDEILDKINLKGYNSLTNEEKEFLKRSAHDSF